MYLTCLNCEAVFEISERHFVDGARQVKCSACQHQWEASANMSATINELMGEQAESAFEGLNNFLGKKDDGAVDGAVVGADDGGTASGTAQQDFASVRESNRDMRQESIALAFKRRGFGYFFLILVFYFIIPICLAVGFLYNEEQIIGFYPDAIVIYDFLQDVGDSILRGGLYLCEQFWQAVGQFS